MKNRMPQISQQEPDVPITEKDHSRKIKEFIFHLFQIQLQEYLTLGTYSLTPSIKITFRSDEKASEANCQTGGGRTLEGRGASVTLLM